MSRRRLNYNMWDDVVLSCQNEKSQNPRNIHATQEFRENGLGEAYIPAGRGVIFIKINDENVRRRDDLVAWRNARQGLQR